MRNVMRRLLSILAAGIVSAVSAAEPSAAGTHVVSASRLVVQADRIFQRTVGVTLTPCERTVGGETRKGVCVEMKRVEKRNLNLSIPLGDIDMMDRYPTVDFALERSEECNVVCEFHGGARVWDVMRRKLAWTNNLAVSKYELGHTPIWRAFGAWMDVSKVRTINFTVPLSGWANTNETFKLWISDIRFTKEDSWRGTERDKLYRSWLAFCRAYEPDLSDSSKYLESPEEGRLAQPLKLVDNRVAKAEIVAPKDVYGSIELAARELQYWIAKMTEVELPIVSEPTGTKPIRIFLNSPAAHRRWSADVAWLKKGRDVDGYFIRTDGNDIHIGCCVPSDADEAAMPALGLPSDACAVGVFRGAVALLENNSTILFQSCDKEYGTVYDKSPDFVVRWGEGRERPATCGRGWRLGTDYSNRRKIKIDSSDMWRARNRTNVTMPHRLSGHAYSAGEMIEYVPNEAPYQIFDGEKRIKHGYYQGQICLSAPDCLEKAIASGVKTVARAREKKNYPIVSCGFWNEDNYKVCVCEGCTKPIKCEDGTILESNRKTDRHRMETSEMLYRSTQYMQFVNKLADGIAARCPGVKTQIFAYYFQRPTPKCKISENVMWLYCPYQYRLSFNEPVYHPLNRAMYDNFTGMLAQGGEMQVYDYHAFSGMNNPYTSLPEAAAADFRYYDSIGAKNIGSEMSGMGKIEKPTAIMNGWLFSRIGWDADITKVEGLRKYYLRRLYREGAPAAEEYYARYRREAIRRRPPNSKAPKMLVGEEAREVFGKYLDKITNPISKRHYEILMNIAVNAGKKK